jgi:putative DNA primase/helicase
MPVADFLATCGADGLGETPSAEAREAVLREIASRLNGDDPLRRATVREALKERGFPARMIDAARVATESTTDRPDGHGARLELSDPEPWPEPVNGAALLAEIRETFERYIVLPEHASVVIALWTMFAHALDAFRIAPQLCLTSAVRECGKSTTLEVLHALLPRAEFAANITPAGVFRVIEKYRPALLIDEADRIFEGPGDELRTLLNASHLRASAKVIRCDGVDFEPRIYSTWCPKAAGLIGALPPTLHNRAFIVPMRKSRLEGDEAREPVELDTLEGLLPLKRRAIRWAADNMEALKAARPDVPGALRSRAADNARPLLAIADLAGAEWPELARKAVTANLTRGADDETEARLILLADLRELYAAGEDLFTRDILARLVEREDRPWGEWRKDKPLTGHALAALLKPFEVRSRTIRVGAVTLKGYAYEDLKEVFERYLPPLPSGVPPAETSHRHNTHKYATNEEHQSVTPSELVTDAKPEEAAEVRHCDGVTDWTGGTGPDTDYEAAEREGMADA